MLSRSVGTWWGTAVEAPDPSALANFYSQLLGWSVVREEPGTAILSAPERQIYLVFQEAPGYQSPVWPPDPASQRSMMHFDFPFGDLDGAVAQHQPQENVRVLFDPAGHPFCLCRERD